MTVRLHLTRRTLRSVSLRRCLLWKNWLSQVLLLWNRVMICCWDMVRGLESLPSNRVEIAVSAASLRWVLCWVLEFQFLLNIVQLHQVVLGFEMVMPGYEMVVPGYKMVVPGYEMHSCQPFWFWWNSSAFYSIFCHSDRKNTCPLEENNFMTAPECAATTNHIP